MKKLLILFFLICIPLSVDAREPKHLQHFEKEYQECWCKLNNGKTEYRLPDKSRVDCVTETHAIEFDFAKKWAESVGQSLYYAEILQKKPGIVLISERGKKDQKFIKRVTTVAQRNGITLWVITPNDIIVE